MEMFVVDAFAVRAFEGNPAAVCLLEAPVSGPEAEEWMRALAREMNLSETAFVAPIEGGYALRWWTPAVEVDLCGHATLASAWILSEQGQVGPLRFQTRSGWLECQRSGDRIEMNFPATPARECEVPADLVDGLGVKALEVLENDAYYLVRVADETTLRRLAPDLGCWGRLVGKGVCVTAEADGSRWDFVSRLFAPAKGVSEDPVTGSTHCMLGPYWGERLGLEEMLGYQASARGGEVQVQLAGPRVRLRGQAVTVSRVLLREAAQPPKNAAP